MMGALEAAFPDVVASFGEDGRKRWRFDGGHLRELLTLAPEELAALDLAISELNRAGSEFEARTLRRLKDKILTLVPRRSMARLETDHEALLEAQGVIARPGPRPKIDEAASEAILDAIKSCHILEICYRSRGDQTARTRCVAPFGILSGARRYLVGRPLDDPNGAIRTYRLDGVDAARVTDRPFVRPDNFNLQEFANRAFGVYQNDAEYGEVVWRFCPEAAEQAKLYQFHPDQTMADEADGSLVVRFSIEPRSFSVVLPRQMSFADFERALQKALQPASLHHWVSTPDGLAHFAKLSIDPAMARRFTDYGYGGLGQPIPAEEIYITRPRVDGDRLVAILETIVLEHLGLLA